MSLITTGPWATTAPAPPDDDRLCRVYGRVADLSGRPVAFQAFTFQLQAAAFYGGVSGPSFILDDLKAVSDRNGQFYADLPRNTDFLLSAPAYRDPIPVRVPDTDVICLSDILFPYPVRLQWFFTDATDDPTLLPIPQDPPGFVDIASGVEYLLTLAVVWSDCSVVPLSTAAYTAGDWTTFERVDAFTLRGAATVGTPATLVSAEEDEFQDLGAMWERAGFDPSTFSPHFFPDQDYDLIDTDVLTFTPA